MNVSKVTLCCLNEASVAGVWCRLQYFTLAKAKVILTTCTLTLTFILILGAILESPFMSCRKGKDMGVNRLYLQPVAELRRTQINVVKSKGILKAPSTAAIRQLTTDHSLGLGVDFAEGGKPENPEKNPRSMGEINYNNSTHIVMSSKFENQHETKPRWSPILL